MRKNKNSTTPQNTQDIPQVISVYEYANLPPDKRTSYDPIKSKYERIPILTKILFYTAAVGIVVYLISLFSVSFSDFFNHHISHYLRMIFAKITGILPFSIAEALIILLPIIIFIIVWHIWKFRCHTWKTTSIALLNVIAILAFIVTTFTLNFAVGYKGSSLDQKLLLDKQKVSATELYESTQYLMQKADEEIKYIEFGEDGFSIMPYGLNEMNDKLIAAYDKFCEEYRFLRNFNSNVKPVMLSEPMSYTHITGVYTFFTGEANINVAFPDYTIPFTAAHELAHQRGIAREDEANMIAFLVCSMSDDPYIRYSAYVNMYEYMASALRKADAELYKSARSQLNQKIYAEQIAYSKFFKKYQKSVAATVSDKVNDTYLKTQGTVGSASYGMVVDLGVAYFKEQNFIN